MSWVPIDDEMSIGGVGVKAHAERQKFACIRFWKELLDTLLKHPPVFISQPASVHCIGVDASTWLINAELVRTANFETCRAVTRAAPS